MKFLAFVTILFTLNTNILASEADKNDSAYLDSKYQNLVHPKKSNLMTKDFSSPSNDTQSVIANQTPIRSQAARGTCSIFSATAYIEGLLVKKGYANTSINLSEEWLEYIAVRNKLSDGSSAPSNFEAIQNYGMASEQSLPYIGEDWTEVNNPLKDDRCGKLTGTTQKSCLIVHRDPKLITMKDDQIKSSYGDTEFINARAEANDLKNKSIHFANSNYNIYDVNTVKQVLLSGTPVVLEVDFYYGAWNHREADEFGIDRNADHFAKGIVAYPEVGSVDFEESPKHPAGHSILVVGFDDNKIVEKTIKMTDGSMKKFTYKGVYYFKNSWGTGSFGKDFEINSVKYPGYGMMVQKYAEEQGQFFQISLK